MSKNKPMEADSSEKAEKADTSSDSPVVSTNKEETPTTTTAEKDAKKAKGNEPPVEDVVVLDKENADVNVSLTTGDKPKKELTNPIFEELKSAFPNIEDKYIKAVLVASQGVINPAFNALLYLSDPSFENEVQLPPQPIRPVRSPTQLQQTQLQQDELLARHLDEQYNQKRESSAHRRHREYARRQQASFPEESDDEDFIDTINRGLQETSKKVGIWWDGIKKNFAEDKERFGDPVHTQPSQNFRQRRFNSFGAHDDEVLTSQTRGNVANARNRRYVHPEEHEDDETDIPPKLPARKATETNDRPADESTETAQPKLWQPRPSQPSRTSPKVSAISASHTPPIAHGPIKLDPDQDEFLINSDDEL